MALASSVVIATVAVIAALTVLETTASASAEQVVLPLNTLKTFTCQETAMELLWYFNGGVVVHLDSPDIDEAPAESLGNGILKQDLIVQVTSAVNNSNITCRALQESGLVTVLEICITVQGYLKAPEPLTVYEVNDSAVKIQWEAPFTLDITDTEPDIIQYTIHIANTHTGYVMQVNVTGTAVEYVFVGEECRDVKYTFLISAWNVVGEGPVGTFPGQSTLKASSDWSLEVMSIAVSLPEEIAEVTCIIQISSDTCPDRPLPETCTIEVASSSGPAEAFPTMVEGEPSVTIQLHNRVGLAVNSAYNLKILCDGSQSTHQFTTFSTQSASAITSSAESEMPGAVDVECKFATDSSAQGCVIDFTRGLDCELEIYREEGQPQARGQIVLPEGTFNPEAYDIDSNGLRSWTQPAVIMEEFTMLSSSTSVCEVKTEKRDDNDSPLLLGIAATMSAVCAALIVAVIVLGVIFCAFVKRQPSKDLIAVKCNTAYETTLPKGVTTQELQPCAAYGVAKRQV